MAAVLYYPMSPGNLLRTASFAALVTEASLQAAGRTPFAHAAGPAGWAAPYVLPAAGPTVSAQGSKRWPHLVEMAVPCALQQPSPGRRLTQTLAAAASRRSRRRRSRQVILASLDLSFSRHPSHPPCFFIIAPAFCVSTCISSSFADLIHARTLPPLIRRQRGTLPGPDPNRQQPQPPAPWGSQGLPGRRRPASCTPAARADSRAAAPRHYISHRHWDRPPAPDAPRPHASARMRAVHARAQSAVPGPGQAKRSCRPSPPALPLVGAGQGLAGTRSRGRESVEREKRKREGGGRMHESDWELLGPADHSAGCKAE